MYNVATILPLWLDHFQNPYHRSHSPTERCPAILFLCEMLFLDVTIFPHIPYFHHIVPPNIILCYCCPHEVAWQHFIILESHLHFSSHKFQEGTSKFCMLYQICKFLANCRTSSSKKSPSHCPRNETCDACHPAILISWSRGIEHMLNLPIYVAFCLFRKIH